MTATWIYTARGGASSRVSPKPKKTKQTQIENMNEIHCPHCAKDFKVDEAGYADILK